MLAKINFEHKKCDDEYCLALYLAEYFCLSVGTAMHLWLGFKMWNVVRQLQELELFMSLSFVAC